MIAPIQDFIRNKPNLMIITDGPLRWIPFEALLCHPPQRPLNFSRMDYLINHHQISYAMSAGLAFRTFLRDSPTYFALNPGLLGVAPVAFIQDSPAEGFVNLLPHSEWEVRSIAYLFEQAAQPADLYLRSEATEKNLIQHIADFSHVHIATHNYVDEKNPYFSHMIFHPEDSLMHPSPGIEVPLSHRDGHLYAREIYKLRLATQLLVLSSCGSGLGKAAPGEGALSLLRAFSYAGVSRIVYTLWDIHDEPTSHLFISFYEHLLKEKQGYEQALRSAKIRMITHPNTAFPLYWSGIVLQNHGFGNPGLTVSQKN
ncbi:MAG: CHAT domain-containing protein [Bacteroidia bacterium]|nr:CHAT domain-containing protein [Bacteroidia bacterium]